MNELDKIKLIIVALAEFFQTELTDNQVEMYSKALVDIPMDQLESATNLVMKCGSFTKFPLPGQIRELIKPKPEEEAVEISARIATALSKFGYTNPERAKEFIGSTGWNVVELNGGWQTMCQTVSADELPILKAQWRELAKTFIKREAFTKETDLVRLPSFLRSIE